MDRVRTARALCEEHRRTLTNEHETIAGELAFLDAEGVSSVPGDVNLVVVGIGAVLREIVLRRNGMCNAGIA